MTIQTTGSYDKNDEIYSLSVCFESHSITLDGLTKEDLEELKSCVSILLDIEDKNFK